MGKKMKIGLIVVAVLVLAGIGQRMLNSKEEDKPIKENVEIVDYEIINKNDNSMPNAKRYALDVVVNEKATEEELKALSEKIVEDIKKEEDFNAISIGFYDDEKDVGEGYTLGSIDYAPNGKWGDASSVKAGQYDKMEYSYNLIENK